MQDFVAPVPQLLALLKQQVFLAALLHFPALTRSDTDGPSVLARNLQSSFPLSDVVVYLVIPQHGLERAERHPLDLAIGRTNINEVGVGPGLPGNTGTA